VLLLRCPHCGPRNSSEFHYAGEIGARPDPRSVEPARWREYLYTRRNPCGPTTERWFHRAGCRRFVTVLRDTLTNEVHATAPVGEPGHVEALQRPAVGVGR